jgi:hypothetical protein
LGSCSYKFEILLASLETDTPSFQFSKPFFAPPKGETDAIELTRFMIVSKNAQGWDYKHPIWDFEFNPDNTEIIALIKYAKMPPNFIETASAKPLSYGLPYLAIAYAAGGFASKEFVFTTSSKTNRQPKTHIKPLFILMPLPYPSNGHSYR